MSSNQNTDLPEEEPSQAGPSPKAPEHLNSSGCRIGYSEGKGRGVYASQDIPAQRVIEISPILVFTSGEYEQHGKHTVLDHYTFKWRDGRMALALGLGSLFNHSQAPNVSYILDSETESIRYMTTRPVKRDEELCIFYGHKLWFDPVDAGPPANDMGENQEDEDGWGGLSVLDDECEVFGDCIAKFMSGDPDELVAEEALPFTRLKTIPDDEDEEELDAAERRSFQLYRASVGCRYSGPTTNNYDAQMAQTERSRDAINVSLKADPQTRYQDVDPSDLHSRLSGSAPASRGRWDVSTIHREGPALGGTDCDVAQIKVYILAHYICSSEEREAEEWSKGKVRWACEMMRRVVQEARQAGRQGELPVAAYVPIPFDEETRVASQMLSPLSAHDTRKSAAHPLRHAILNLVRALADYRATVRTDAGIKSPLPQLTPIVDDPDVPPHTPDFDTADMSLSATKNGAHYLLTSLTLFTTHEPCIMCSMALLHSRVKEVFYLIPMDKTGGCGGVTCVPKLEGVNHRFGIHKWKMDSIWTEGLEIDSATDA
ncbi:SET domain-containing protein 7 [Grifola frondosa]|uniref:SET domain-containing protein 7 n=1 Tax=Grifola frondosa TaxID=5627 RepID=A0A1C7LVE5_GRIFR|nr:SET domain-containing protein 7 [Grifola frondosa]